MNRDQARGCGCLAGLVAALAVLGAGGLFLLVALVSFIGWPLALALGAVLTGAAVALVHLAVRYVVAASRRSRTTGPYRAKLSEIDRLRADIEAAVFRVAGSELGAGTIRAQLLALMQRRDAVLAALIEIDEFLRSPSNRELRMRTETTYLRVRERLAGEAVRSELAENATRLKDIQTAVAAVKAERQALIANLDRIAIGLREIRARTLPTAASASSGQEIARDLSRLTEAITTEERIRRELDALETGEGPAQGPPPRRDRLGH